ncbi:MAG: transcriptional repressor [Clostridia bacterium]|nr:transcriptional repressor [Clostridia bacterium]
MAASNTMMSLPKLEEYLSAKGYRLTDQRRALLQVLWEADCCLTAQELYTRVLAARPGTNFSTVYRNLEVLNQLGVICLVDNGQQAHAFELNVDGAHHHHIVCRSCGRTRRLDFCPFDAWSGPEGFVCVEHKFEVYGYCESCSPKARKR